MPGMNLVMSTASTSSSATASSQVIHSRISQAPPAEKQSSTPRRCASLMPQGASHSPRTRSR
ncbi:hypothetical protein [Streptosporangium longisporum]|uniref:hypothetical protein n=1 Tax=Streptosporangium longisporum TaxID=46187 RepID=UPI0031EE78C9